MFFSLRIWCVYQINQVTHNEIENEDTPSLGMVVAEVCSEVIVAFHELFVVVKNTCNTIDPQISLHVRNY